MENTKKSGDTLESTVYIQNYILFFGKFTRDTSFFQRVTFVSLAEEFSHMKSYKINFLCLGCIKENIV